MLSQQFRVFLTVAECGSFSGAAKKLLVTPASVMKHMNALEARIGAALLIRTHRGGPVALRRRAKNGSAGKRSRRPRQSRFVRRADRHPRGFFSPESQPRPDRSLAAFPSQIPDVPIPHHSLRRHERTYSFCHRLAGNEDRRTGWLFQFPDYAAAGELPYPRPVPSVRRGAPRCPAIIPWRGKSASSRKTSTAKCCGW